jgi:hypothetical protein
MPWVWGEGSVVWLAAAGLRGVDLGAIRPIKAPPSPGTTSHALLVSYSAARVERRGLRWLSARELAADPDRWAVTMRDERGYRQQLPDLVGWVPGYDTPVALVGEEGHRREDRQRMILEGWRDAINQGRYSAVRYDCATDAAAARILRLARKARLGGEQLAVSVQLTVEEIRAITPNPEPEPAPTPLASTPELGLGDELPEPEPQPVIPPTPTPTVAAPPPPEPGESAEAAAERERRYRELMGIPQPGRRRRRSR